MQQLRDIETIARLYTAVCKKCVRDVSATMLQNNCQIIRECWVKHFRNKDNHIPQGLCNVPSGKHLSRTFPGPHTIQLVLYERIHGQATGQMYGIVKSHPGAIHQSQNQVFSLSSLSPDVPVTLIDAQIFFDNLGAIYGIFKKVVEALREAMILETCGLAGITLRGLVEQGEIQDIQTQRWWTANSELAGEWQEAKQQR
ncbi:hypothetical protein DFH08DRAFT_826229 [Mycena albidolilacea]|uniref:Uncharacterized protein n=1 Tax=Mycena albidolilacea TaxID=1033008 RepID=A0AAD7E9G6_9AGAR|nr:hypothetical protein DFH08DRAFT_826229 [Mycena albidolilacea]